MLKTPKTLLVIFSCALSSLTFADPVWEFIDESQQSSILDSIKSPENAIAALPIEIPIIYLSSFQVGNDIEARVTQDSSIIFQVADTLEFPNGDRGWNGSNNAGGALQTFSMTAGNVFFLASVVTKENSFRVIAKKNLTKIHISVGYTVNFAKLLHQSMTIYQMIIQKAFSLTQTFSR